MRNTKQLGIIASILFLIFSGLALPAVAQERDRDRSDRERTRRPIIIRQVVYRDPFWYDRFWHDPWYSRYRAVPYRSFESERYRKEKKVDEEARELRQEREKANRDGVVTAKEEKEIREEYEEYRKAVDDLNSFLRSYGVDS